MSKGLKLEEIEKGQILAYIDEKKSISFISNKLKRSRKVITNFLKNKEVYGCAKRSGRPGSLSSRMKREIIKFVKGKNVTANQIKAHFGLKVSCDTILRMIHKEGTLKRRKYKCKPFLSAKHKADRIEFCRYNMDRGDKWKNIIFSDEKKFNLDGPDGYNYYWHALGSSYPFLSRKCGDKSSVIVWGSFSFFGRSKLAFLNEAINSNSYQRTLNHNLIPFMRGLNLDDLTFQHDNARPHVSASTLNWLEDRGIETLEWPAYSPDLNPIENLWGILVQRVYSNGRCYENIDELKKSIEFEWKNIEIRVLESLILSMKDRMFAVLVGGGNITKY